MDGSQIRLYKTRPRQRLHQLPLPRVVPGLRLRLKGKVLQLQERKLCDTEPVLPG